jgi:hypothetical protein
MAARSRLVGQPLLYAISVFASLGVFLVSLFDMVTASDHRLTTERWDSLAMTKGVHV